MGYVERGSVARARSPPVRPPPRALPLRCRGRRPPRGAGPVGISWVSRFAPTRLLVGRRSRRPRRGSSTRSNPRDGKSAFAKRQMVGMAGAGVRPVVLGDPKAVQRTRVRDGGQANPGGSWLDRINLLDSQAFCGRRSDGDQGTAADGWCWLCGLSVRTGSWATGRRWCWLQPSTDWVRAMVDPTVPMSQRAQKILPRT